MCTWPRFYWKSLSFLKRFLNGSNVNTSPWGGFYMWQLLSPWCRFKMDWTSELRYFVFTYKLWNEGYSTKMSGCVCDGTCLQQIVLNQWIRQLSKLITEQFPSPSHVWPGALLDFVSLWILECYSLCLPWFTKQPYLCTCLIFRVLSCAVSPATPFPFLLLM